MKVDLIKCFGVHCPGVLKRTYEEIRAAKNAVVPFYLINTPHCDQRSVDEGIGIITHREKSRKTTVRLVLLRQNTDRDTCRLVERTNDRWSDEVLQNNVWRARVAYWPVFHREILILMDATQACLLAHLSCAPATDNTHFHWRSSFVEAVCMQVLLSVAAGPLVYAAPAPSTMYWKWKRLSRSNPATLPHGTEPASSERETCSRQPSHRFK